MKKTSLILVLVAVAAMVCSCSGLENAFGGKYGASGSIQKGPFVEGSTISIQTLDDNLNPTGNYYSTTTKSDMGDYLMETELDSRYIEVIADGYYFNECTGRISTSQISLRAIMDLSEKGANNVNILTTLEAERIRTLMKQGMDFKKAKKQAQSEVLAVFGINNKDLKGFDKMDLGGSDTGDAILVAITVMLQVGRTEGELSELYSKMANQIASSGSSWENYKSNIGQIDVMRVYNNINGRYGQCPEFWKYIDLNGDGQLGESLLAVDNTQNNVDCNGGSFFVDYVSDGDVQVDVIDLGTFKEADWIHITSTKAVGYYQISYTIDANPSTIAKNALISLRSEDNITSTSISVQQEPDFSQVLIIEPNDGKYWMNNFAYRFSNVKLKGEFSHEALRKITGFISPDTLDLSELKTPDSTIGYEESFYVKTISLPVDMDTIYSGLITGDNVDITNWGSIRAKTLIADDYVGDYISNGLFNGAWRPTTISLPSTVIEVRGALFYNWTWLESVALDDNLDISDCTGIFRMCDNLKYVKLPANLKKIPALAFSFCFSLNEVIMPQVDELELGYGCFTNTHYRNDRSGHNKTEEPIRIDLRRYSKITIGDESDGNPDCDSAVYLVNAPSDVFNTIARLSFSTEMEVFVNEKYVDEDTFSDYPEYNGAKIVGYHFGPDVKKVGSTITGRCIYPYGTSLVTVTFDNPDTIWGKSAFGGLLLKECPDFPSSMTIIPDGCFSGSFAANYTISSAVSITIPNTITSIGVRAFSAGSRIKSIVIPDSVQSIGVGAFSGCYTDIGNKYGLEQITFSSGMTSIPDGCCEGCKLLSDKGIIIPSSVKTIGYNAFSGCNIKSLSFLPSALDEFPFNAIGNYRDEEIIVPEGIKSVSPLGNDLRVSKIVLPRSLTSIPYNFSYANQYIEEIVVNEGISDINLDSFVGPILSTITLPSTVTNIDGDLSSYSAASSKVDLYLKATTPPTIGDGLPMSSQFYDPARQTLTIYIPRGSTSAYLADAEWAKYSSVLQEYDF